MATYHAATCHACEQKSDEWAPPRVAPLPPPLRECLVSCSPCSRLFAHDQVNLSYPIKDASATAWNMLDLALALSRHDHTSVVATADATCASGGTVDGDQEAFCSRCSRQYAPACCCGSLLQIDPAELCALFCGSTSRDGTVLRHPLAAGPLLANAPVFARCIRLRCILFDVVLHDGAGNPNMIDSGLCSSPSVTGALAVAVCAHTGAGVTEDGGVDDGHGSSNWLSLSAASSVASTACALTWLVKVFLPLSQVPALAIGLTLTRPAFSGSDNEVGAGTPMQWCYVERSTSCSVPYDALWAHWTAMVTPPESLLAGSRLASAPCFAEGDHDDDFIVWDRLQHYAERATTVLFGGQPAGSVTPKSTRLCALLAVLGDVRACATRRSTSNPLPVLLSDETNGPQRLLFQWFTFLGLRSASSLECRPSLGLSTEIHAIASTPDWLAELSACHSVFSLGHWLHLVSQWLTFRVLEAALELLPSMLRWGGRRCVSAETHLLFRADVDSSRCCSPGLCSGADSTACPARKKGGFAQLRPSCWMRYRTTASTPVAAPPSVASIAAALPELPKAEAVLVCVLERLMSAAIGPADGSRKPPCRSATAHALILEPEAHGVVTCRLHLGSPPPKWQRNGLSVRGAGVPPLSKSFATRPLALSSAPPAARAAHAPVVAAFLSWYALDFDAVFGRLYRVWRLAQRYHSHCTAKSCGEIGAAGAAAPHDNDPWRGVVDTAVRCYSDDPGCSGQAPEGPALGSLGRCLLLALWLSLALVDVDEGVGAATSCPPLAWKGTLYYSSRRNVLHVRDWGTALHIRHVASCLSAGALQDGNSTGRECGAAVKEAVSTVVNSFNRARAATVAAQARARLQAPSTTHLPFPEAHDSRGHATTTSRGAGDTTGCNTCRLLRISRDDSAAAEDDDECVLLSWSCDTAKEESGSREGGSGVPLVQQQQGKPRTGGDDPLASTDPLLSTSLQSSWLDYSIEEFAEANDGTIGQPPVTQAPAPQVREGPEQSALHPAVAVPLIELESHLRELLTRNALSEMLSLVGLTGGLEWRTCDDGEVTARQRLTSHARSHSVRAEARRRFGGSSALHVDTVQLHEDEQPPSPAAAAAARVDVSLSTRHALAALASSKAARLQEDEESARTTLCGAEHRMRQYTYARCTHIGGLILLQSQEARGRLHLSQVWELEQEEWQMRWSTVLVPECVLRSLLHEKAAAGAWKALPRQEEPQERQQHDCRHHNRRLGYAPQWHQRGPRGRAASVKVDCSPLTPTADEAWAHRMFLLCGDVEEVDRGAQDRRSERNPRAKADASHSPPSCQRRQQELQMPLLAPLRSPSLMVRPRRAPWQACPDKPAARVPVSMCPPAAAAAARSAVPVLSISLCETPPSAPARTPTRRCLNELPLNHRRIDAGFARIAPPHQLVSPPSTAAICWRLPAEDGGALVHHGSPRRKVSLLKHRDTHCDTAARRRPSAGESASAAGVEAICTAAAIKCNRADSESGGVPLATARPVPSTAKERLATHAGPPVLTHVATHVASTTSVPPRRLRTPVVTWSDDVQQY